jgi:Hypothetical protein (DUF2513)
MKRDMDLIRSILLTVEDDPGMTGQRFIAYNRSDFPGHTQEEINYHIDLPFEGRLVAGMPNANPVPLITKLTWGGHEFIAATKDPDVWQRVKDRLKGVAGVGIPLVLEVAKDEIKKKLLG